MHSIGKNKSLTLGHTSGRRERGWLPPASFSEFFPRRYKSSTKKYHFLLNFYFLVKSEMAAKMAAVVGDVVEHRTYFIFMRRSKVFTEERVVSKYCNISKTLGMCSTTPSFCTTVGESIRSRVNSLFIVELS